MEKTVKTPTTRAEAERLIERLARAAIERSKLETDANEKAHAIQAQLTAEVRPLNDLIEEAVDALHHYAEVNRDELTDGGVRKTVELGTGEIAWRMSPPKVNVRNKDQVLTTLKKMKLDHLIKVEFTEDIDKHAVLTSPDDVAGVRGLSVTQQEHFVVKPYDSKAEHAKLVRRSS